MSIGAAETCAHLATTGDYRDTCTTLAAKYPNLRNKDYKDTDSIITGSVEGRHGFRLVSIEFQLSQDHGEEDLSINPGGQAILEGAANKQLPRPSTHTPRPKPASMRRHW